MFYFENTIVINRPVKEVFAFLVDLPSIPKWNYYVLSVVPTSPQSGSVGSTYHQIRKDDEQDLKISKLEPNQVLVVETVPPSKPELRREILFETEGQSTRVTDKWQLDMGVPKLLEPLAAQRAKTGVRENLDKLKELLEFGRVTLQDGRSFNR
ncbi:MAG TPA: SRPBCC family protein [Anaerolineales bacterium]|nr:SRPBCC family protein [Anaerolineales bacterium]HLO29813.1 SRPBCC family protein [Anaerolineales bacterium]